MFRNEISRCYPLKSGRPVPSPTSLHALHSPGPLIKHIRMLCNGAFARSLELNVVYGKPRLIEAELEMGHGTGQDTERSG
jgi:hypothetical protein